MKYPELSEKTVLDQYSAAQDIYGELNIDTEVAIQTALEAPISLHCWQADDVTGLEGICEETAGGGIMATGNYPGKARNGEEMRQDFNEVLSLLPGTHKLNIHASYAEKGGDKVDRDAYEPKHFTQWIEWAKEHKLGLDFNTTNYAHPKANDGMTLSHPDSAIRDFWVQHGIACRSIAEHMGKELNNPCVLNHWLPDGMKDDPADRWSPRQRLLESLDRILSKEHGIDTTWCNDAVESKLFGIGSEAYVVGSFEFYCGYALSRKIKLCLDMGHFHPTETIHDKISSLLLFLDSLLIHVSRPIRWDSDHVVLFNDDVRAVFQELIRGGALDRVALALDFFDAGINRIAAYVIGTRASRKALLYALLEPVQMMQELERNNQNGPKLAVMEEAKTLPFPSVWNMLCVRAGVPAGMGWLNEIESYENKILSKRV